VSIIIVGIIMAIGMILDYLIKLVIVLGIIGLVRILAIREVSSLVTTNLGKILNMV